MDCFHPVKDDVIIAPCFSAGMLACPESSESRQGRLTSRFAVIIGLVWVQPSLAGLCGLWGRLFPPVNWRAIFVPSLSGLCGVSSRSAPCGFQAAKGVAVDCFHPVRDDVIIAPCFSAGILVPHEGIRVPSGMTDLTVCGDNQVVFVSAVPCGTGWFVGRLFPPVNWRAIFVSSLSGLCGVSSKLAPCGFQVANGLAGDCLHPLRDLGQQPGWGGEVSFIPDCAGSTGDFR